MGHPNFQPIDGVPVFTYDLCSPPPPPHLPKRIQFSHFEDTSRGGAGRRGDGGGERRGGGEVSVHGGVRAAINLFVILALYKGNGGMEVGGGGGGGGRKEGYACILRLLRG